MTNYSAPVAIDQSQVYDSLTPLLGSPVLVGSQALSEAKKPLGSNTEQSSPYGPLNALETTFYKAFKAYEPHKKVYVLHSIVKEILNTAGDFVYLPIESEGTHWKDKRRSGVFHSTRENKLTHYRLVDGSGYERYIPLSQIRKGRYCLDEETGQFRKAMSWEAWSHHRVGVKFYRCGACQSVSTSYRPEKPSIFGFDEFNDGRHDLNSADYAWMADNVSNVRVNVEKKPGKLYKAYMSGLMSCDSVHLCPTCQPIVAECHKKEVNITIYNHYKRGGYIVLMTTTMRHKKNFPLKQTLMGSNESITSLRNGKAWKGFCDRHGLLYYIDASEYKYSESNGHHPHKHIVLFLDKKPDINKMHDELFPRYKTYFKNRRKEGYLIPSYEKGIDLQWSASSEQVIQYLKDNPHHKQGEELPTKIKAVMENISSYVTKGLDVGISLEDSCNSDEWTVSSEITKGYHKDPFSVKKYNNGSEVVTYTAIGFLFKYYFASKALTRKGLSDDERLHYRSQAARFKSLYQEYAICYTGKVQLRFSKHLKSVYEVKENLEMMIGKEEEKRAETSDIEDIGALTVNHLRLIAKHKLKARVLIWVENARVFNDDTEKIFKSVCNWIESFEDVEQPRFNIGDDK
ncbi:MAG: hypothetical protein COA42_23660 [Alteromonadaceae bacterium]|nr:MAG: hypothetical protein COA42_23660 [Alteromonadaceae bacterium]